MTSKHIRTTADLVRFGAGLKIDCGGCGASRTLDGLDVGKLGGAVPLAKLRERLKCHRCGAKEAKLAVLPPV